jgi:hypothetical protein
MANIEDAPRLRELCEKASKEYDHEKLIDLIRQINELLEKKRRSQENAGKQGAPVVGLPGLMGYPDWLDLYWMIRPAVRRGRPIPAIPQ